jgi:Mrp family chromosome partitioning ATPase
MNVYETASLGSVSGLARPSPFQVGDTTFDLLRARVEADITPPAIIAITSALTEDGRELASRGLASSLSTAGYATLLLDTSLDSRSLFSPPTGLFFDDIARQLIAPDPASGILVFLTLSDARLQRTTSQRRIESCFEILRSKFDYIIISTGGASDSFATSVLSGADSILVSVKLGRRERREDAALSRDLANMGSRFLGVIALQPATIAEPPITAVPHAFSHTRRISQDPVESDLRRREVA